MSIDITNKVWLRGPQDAKQRLLLMAIADHANQDGRAFPGVELLAQKSCQSVRNALRGILKLEREGWVFVMRRRSGDRARGNEYQVNLARLSDERQHDEKEAVSKAAQGNPSRHDTVSLGEAIGEANTEACSAPSDRMSCGEIEPDSAVHQVTKSGHEVTKQASPGDKMTPRIENRKEPSKEPIPPIAPQGGRAIETADPDGNQRALWELTNRVRARERQRPIEWERWVEETQLAGAWPEKEKINQIPAGNSGHTFRRIRKRRNSEAVVGVFSG